MILNFKIYQSMLPVNHNHTERENILEKRIETLQKRIFQLETERSLKSSSFLVLPVTYTPEYEQSPKLEFTSYTPVDERDARLLLVEQSNPRVFETHV